MNIKNKSSLKTGILLASLLIVLFRCHFVDAWQPDLSAPNMDPDINTQWGLETNNVKVGLLIQDSSDASNHTMVGFYPVLNNSSATNGNATPGRLNLWLPPFDSRYRMELIDANGNAVPKTAKGKVLGRPIDQPFKHYRGGISEGVNIAGGYRGRILLPNTRDLIPTDAFVLEDYFAITNAGKYHLKFEMQVIWITSGWKSSLLKSNPPAMWLPPVNAEIEIKKP
jgi:hypothetical protein